MIIKTIKQISIIVCAIFGFCGVLCNAQLYTPNGVSDIQGMPYESSSLQKKYPGGATPCGCDTSDLACVMNCNDIQSKSSLLDRLLSVFNLNSPTYEGTPKFIAYVKFIVNMGLGLLSFVALIMLIYTFYMMFFTESDAGKKKAIGNLKGIFIALIIMGLSRLIVSFVFWWYKENRQNNTQLVKNIDTNIQITNIEKIENQNNFYLYA